MDINIIKKELVFCGYEINQLSNNQLIELFQKHCEENSTLVSVSNLKNKYLDKYVCIDTPDGFQEITDFFIKKERMLYDIKLSNGAKCTSSNDHLYETTTGWKKAEELTKEDVLLTKDGYYEIVSVTKTNRLEKVYDWTVNHENHRYFAGKKGISSHNSGKTFLTLNTIRNAQKMGYTPIYFDTEGAIDPESCKNFGIDVENFRYEPVSEIEKLKTIYAILIKNLSDLKKKGETIPKFLLILDSIGMVASSKEIEDAKTGNSAADMTRAKQIRSFFRIITSDLNSLGIPMIFTNHTLVNIGGYGDPVVQGGGGGVVYSPSITLFLSKAKETEGSDANKKQVGIIVTAKTGKNRYAKPKVIKFPIFFDRPFNRYMGIQDYISWENVGIAKGNILTEKEYSKLKGADLEKAVPFTPDNSEELMYFLPKETARNYVVRHLGECVDSKNLFTDRVMLPLEDTFDEIIRKDFEFSSHEYTEEIASLLDDEVDSEDLED